MKQEEKKALDSIARSLSVLGHPFLEEGLADMAGDPAFMLQNPLATLDDLCSQEATAVSSRRLDTRLKMGRLAGCAAEIGQCVDSDTRACLPQGIVPALSTLGFLDKGLNIAIFGPSGAGRTYLARALGVQACVGHRCEYGSCNDILEQLAMLKADSPDRHARRKKALIRVPLLMLDDFLLHPVMSELERHLLFDILEGRSEARHSTIICSQRAPKAWTAQLGNDPVVASAIATRATRHFSVCIELREPAGGAADASGTPGSRTEAR